VILETLKAEGKAAEAQMARAYGVYPVTLAKWKHHLLEHGTEVFGGKNGDGWRVTREEGCEELGRVIGKQLGHYNNETSALTTRLPIALLK